MTDKMKAFLAEAEKDAAFAEKLNGADAPETVIALAKEKGFELTETDLRPEEAASEMSDEELDGVAGGMNIGPVATWSGLMALLTRSFGGKKGLLRGVTQAQTLEYRGDGPVARTLEYRGGTPVAQTMQLHVGEDDGNKWYSI